MNDFTKEELKEIYLSLFDPDSNFIGENLLTKLRIMIKNYCEHEPSGAHYEQFRWEVCGKCGVQYK